MERYDSIDAKIAAGYDYILKKKDYPGGCDKWLEAWEEIKGTLAEGIATDIYDLDSKYKWKQWPSNYVQDLEAELLNAGIKDGRYHQKRVTFCQELLQWCEDETICNNLRIGLAEGYYMAGDETAGECVFKEWVRDDPDNGWCYTGWADCYRMIGGADNLRRAEKILLTGFARSDVRDKDFIGERLCLVYEDMGEQGKAEEYRKYCPNSEYAEPSGSNPSKPEPVRAVKIGRNEACPCGSGKKYKKCCGR